MPERRLLLVHAHPDDESILTGGLMARCVDEGIGVTLVTCTRGEEGEIVPEDLRHLGTGKQLADVRAEELARAMAHLGVTDHRFLGPYEDSGMIGTPQNDKPTAFWNADLDEASSHLVRVIQEVRPQVVVTYDERGGYGHPDHIQAHRVTLLALAAAVDGDDGWSVDKLYFVASRPRSLARAEAAVLAAAGHPGGFSQPVDDPAHPRGTPDELITTAVDITAQLGRKRAAMAEHRTQLTVAGYFFALSDNVGHPLRDTEWYLLARGRRAAGGGLEAHLFDEVPA